MPNYPHVMNPAGFLSVSAGITPAAALAGGTGDNTAVYSPTFDKTAQPQNFESALLSVQARAVIGAEGATLAVTTVLEETDAADFSDPADITSTALGTLTLTGGVGGSTETGIATYAVDEQARKTRWRYKITPNLSAANTDTAQVMATLIRNGARQLPV